MRKRDKARLWGMRSRRKFGKDILVGNNKKTTQRLESVEIGDWLKITLIEANKTAKEVYRVKFGEDTWFVSILDNGDVSINLH